MSPSNNGLGRRPLKVLAVHRYYWPDSPPYASMLRAIVTRWVADGHCVEVLSSQPNYKPGAGIARQARVEVLDGARVRRLSLPAERGRPIMRLINIVRFTLAILTHSVFRGRFDVIMVSTAPPVLTGAVARLACKLTGARLIYHCMDVHPEIGRLSGEFSNARLFRLLQWIDTKTCNQASAVVVLSNDMARAISGRPGCDCQRIRVINNFRLPDFSDDPAPGVEHQHPDGDATFRLLFAGNIGRFQGLQNVVSGFSEIAARYPDADLKLVLMGDGAAVEELKELAGDLAGISVVFLPHAPLSQAQAMMRSCDAGLISLAPEIYKYAFPSKTMTLLAEGCPLVIAVEPESELARFVSTNNIGIAVSPNSPQQFARQLVKFAGNSAGRAAMRESVKMVSGEYFEPEVTLDKWTMLLDEIGSSAEKRYV